MAANWLRDMRNVQDADAHSAGVTQCLLEEVENHLTRSYDRRISTVTAVTSEHQEQPNYLWLTSAWSPSLGSVSGRGGRDLSCRERCELEELFHEVKGYQCGQIIREFRQQATEIKTAQEATSLMKDIVKAIVERKGVEIKAKKSSTITAITSIKSLETIDGTTTVSLSGGGKRIFLRQRFRSIAYAFVHPPSSRKIAPDSDACPTGRRLTSWNEL